MDSPEGRLSLPTLRRRPGTSYPSAVTHTAYFNCHTQLYPGLVRSIYRLTLQGADNAMEHGVTPRDLWQIIESTGRLFVPVGEQSRFVVGQLESGRWIGFLAQEADAEDDVWEIVAARELDEQEIKQVRRARGDRDA
jgi:hypothetical protein